MLSNSGAQCYKIYLSEHILHCEFNQFGLLSPFLLYFLFKNSGEEEGIYYLLDPLKLSKLTNLYFNPLFPTKLQVHIPIAF